MENKQCRIKNTECEMQNLRCGMWDRKCKLQNGQYAEYSTKIKKYKM